MFFDEKSGKNLHMKEVLFHSIGHSLFFGIGFVICYFVTLRYGQVYFAWYTLEDYRFWLFYWMVCCLLALYGRYKMIHWMEIGCIFSIITAQIYGYISAQRSILRFEDSEIILFLGMIVFLIVGMGLELGKRKSFKKIECFCLLFVLLIDLFACYHFVNRIHMHVGAERGYLAGYEQGVYDVENGEYHYSDFYTEEKVAQEGFQSGSAEWSGYLQYYSSGYSAGRKDAGE